MMRWFVTNKKILIIGKFPPPIGGTTVSLEFLREYLMQYPEYIFFDLHTLSSAEGKTVSFLRLIRDLFASRCWSFHVSDEAAIKLLPYLYFLSLIMGKKFIYRQFGGSIVETYIAATKLQKFLYIKMVSGSAICYFQTKYIIEFFGNLTIKGNLKWLPTHRPKVPVRFLKKEKRFLNDSLNIIFINRLENNKGVETLVEICAGLENVCVKLFGPVGDDLSIDLRALPSNVSYGGVLPATQVQQALINSDLMVLLSTHPGEGYSGAIIEAILTETPMMLSDIKPFREILSDNQAFFVSPNDKKQILKCLKTIAGERESLLGISNKLSGLHKSFDIRVIGESLHKDHQLCVE